ncbi:MAG TPA: hypothetical protein HPP97_12930 [Desulfuromonadales bacterium]|nr:hypothetical protein [Desulfuromonadales bacterium]
MNRILNAITAALAMISCATSVFAADAIAPAPPVQATKPRVAETNAKHKQREIDARAAQAAAAKKAPETATPADEVSAAARAAKLEKRNKAAKDNSKKLKKTTSTVDAPAPAVK